MQVLPLLYGDNAVPVLPKYSKSITTPSINWLVPGKEANPNTPVKSHIYIFKYFFVFQIDFPPSESKNMLLSFKEKELTDVNVLVIPEVVSFSGVRLAKQNLFLYRQQIVKNR